MQSNSKIINSEAPPFNSEIFDFRTVSENMAQMIAIVDPNNYSVKYINHVGPGFTIEGVIGKIIFDFTFPQHEDEIKNKIDEVKSTGQSTFLDLEVASTRYPLGKAWYRTYFSAIPNSKNADCDILVLLEDLTESKLHEIESINTSERIKAIINNTNDVICSIDLEYNLLEFNSRLAALVKMGYDINLEPGMPVLNFIDPIRHENLKLLYKRVQLGESCVDLASFATKNGNVVYNETNYNPIYNSDKQIIGISIFSKDISERFKNEQKIKNALKEKEVLLAEIHHRIKNNLAMVSSLLELQEMNINNTEAKAALETSRKRIKSTALIHELLYSNDSFHQINLKVYLTKLFDLLKINEDVILVLTGNEVNLELTTAMPLGLMMNEILLNSFKHSHKAAGPGKTEINLIIKENCLIINYCDCKGIFPDHVDFMNSNTTGLTLIHTFVEQLNGSIELISKAPPKYKIQIPLNEN